MSSDDEIPLLEAIPEILIDKLNEIVAERKITMDELRCILDRGSEKRNDTFTFSQLLVVSGDTIRRHFDAIFQELHDVGLYDAEVIFTIMGNKNKGIRETYRMYKGAKEISTVEGERIEKCD